MSTEATDLINVPQLRKDYLLPDEPAIYLAGLVDGEGNIDLHIQHRDRPTYNLRLTIAMTNPAALRWCLQTFGGCLYERRAYSHRHHVCYAWAVNDHRALAVIKTIAPYLKVKWAQAVWAIWYGEHLTGQVGHRVSQELRQQRARVREEIRKLNARGPQGGEVRDTRDDFALYAA